MHLMIIEHYEQGSGLFVFIKTGKNKEAMLKNIDSFFHKSALFFNADEFTFDNLKEKHKNAISLLKKHNPTLLDSLKNDILIPTVDYYYHISH